MKVGLNTTFDHESCMEHNETLVQTNLSTDQKDSNGSDDADSSVLSEGVLTEIVVDTNDVSRDLLPNPVYFLPSRSHSLSNSLDSDCKKNDGTHSLSDSSQSRMHDNKHVSDNEINQGLIIEESDLVTTISMKKSIDEATASNNNISSKDISHLHDTHNNMVEHPRPNSSCKSYVMLHVDESLMNSDDVNMKNSNPDCSSKSQIAGRSRLRKSDIQDNALPKKCFDIKFSQEWGDDVRQEVVSLGDEEVKSSHVNTTTIRSNRSNQEVCCDMGLGEKQPVPDDRLTASVSREGKENSKIRQSKNLQST
ncbi:unnamed protein product [Heterobilharzia americana]|nr:unnamed protein product [Heterobilharzia americana]